MIELSVVLISKNQAWNISRLIESVLQATSSIISKEVILVDSASTDETVEMASRYPISIVRLQPGQRLSPAIGRYTGYTRTQPELGLRIRNAGYQILELDYPIVRHYNNYPPEAISTVLSRRRRNFFLGSGQCLRYHSADGMLWPYIRERGRWSLVPALWLVAGVASLSRYLIARDPTWFRLWVLVLVLLLTGAAFRKRSLRRALVAAFNRLLM